MSRVDVYMFPCYDCGDAEGQVSDTVSYLQSNNAKYTAFWLDIEGTQYWSTVKSNNQDFFNSLVSEAQKLGQTIGVYTSESQWNSIMGGSFTAGSKFPLWYPHYQIPADPSFDDFSSFAGWTSPAMKVCFFFLFVCLGGADVALMQQYSGDDTDCSVNLDQNYALSLKYT